MVVKHALTETRRQILENIKGGKEPYTGFENSDLGGAIRSVQTWVGFFRLIDIVNEDPPVLIKLSPEGEEALETGYY